MIRVWRVEKYSRLSELPAGFFYDKDGDIWQKSSKDRVQSYTSAKYEFPPQRYWSPVSYAVITDHFDESSETFGPFVRAFPPEAYRGVAQNHKGVVSL